MIRGPGNSSPRRRSPGPRAIASRAHTRAFRSILWHLQKSGDRNVEQSGFELSRPLLRLFIEKLSAYLAINFLKIKAAGESIIALHSPLNVSLRSPPPGVAIDKSARDRHRPRGCVSGVIRCTTIVWLVCDLVLRLAGEDRQTAGAARIASTSEEPVQAR